MRSPLIGLTTYNGKNKGGHPMSALLHKYIDVLTQAGAIPVMIPSGLPLDVLADLLTRLDGVLFSGGGDVSRHLYGGGFSKRIAGVDPRRDAVERALLQDLMKIGKPFLGICRGLQMINVALGGTLYTDLGEQIPSVGKHDLDSGTQRDVLAHTVSLVPGTRLANACGELEFMVNSLHHQAVRDLAPGLVASAFAPQGLIEGIEISSHPFQMAVQWHPEWLPSMSHARRLFAAFVEVCRQ